MKKKDKKRLLSTSRSFTILGILLIVFGIVIVTIIYAPIAVHEVQYSAKQLSKQQSLTPVNTDFGIVIEKIGANANIIANVDPYNSRIYQQALTQGVAHANGTAYPGQIGTIFLFSHSSSNILDAVRYNSIFYLLTKLSPGDTIQLYYQNEPYTYQVTESKIVSPSQVSYLSQKTTEETLTLMTCWPAGTALRRLLVIAKRI